MIDNDYNDDDRAVNTMPVIISGSGGSGTRVVAEILTGAGVYLGSDLNASSDNLLFTYFFKRPQRFAKDYDEFKLEHRDLYDLHERLFFGYSVNKAKDWRSVLKVGWDHVFHERYYNWRWVLERWRKMIRPNHQKKVAFWGWKEPHNAFHLRGIHDYYPGGKYIHVLRDGLDMAYSRNQQQLRNWGRCFHLDPDDSAPRNRFEFWYRFNKQTIVIAKELFPSFLALKFEDLCLHTQDTIQQLIEFTGLNSRNIPPEVWNIPRLPSTYKRYHDFDLSWVNSEVMKKLSELGYVHRI